MKKNNNKKLISYMIIQWIIYILFAINRFGVFDKIETTIELLILASVVIVIDIILSFFVLKHEIVLVIGLIQNLMVIVWYEYINVLSPIYIIILLISIYVSYLIDNTCKSIKTLILLNSIVFICKYIVTFLLIHIVYFLVF